MNAANQNSAGGGPKSRMCYVCGLQTLLTGYDYHVKQCKDLFVKREALKPKSERRPLIEDPMIAFLASQPSKTGGSIDYVAFEKFEKGIVAACMFTCPDCNRHFNEQAFSRHVNVCKQVFGQPRRAVVSKIPPWQLPKVQPERQARPPGKAGPPPNKACPHPKLTTMKSTLTGTSIMPRSQGSEWVNQTDGPAFNKNQIMREARQISLFHRHAKASGIIPLSPITTNPPATATRSSSHGPASRSGAHLIRCPTCGRKFSQMAAVTHIVQCNRQHHQ